MEQRHRHGYLYGTMVLAAGTVVVKLIGALFKIPLTNILGGVGMSYFNVAYELYYPLYALFVSGVPVAVSKLVSESMACGRARDARKLLRVAGAAFLAVGAAGSLLMFFGAGWFSARVQNPGSVWAVRMLSPALFFGCLMAALRGYWQGMQDMAPTAVSQIVEAVAKLAFGLALSYGVTVAGLRQFSLEGTGVRRALRLGAGGADCGAALRGGGRDPRRDGQHPLRRGLHGRAPQARARRDHPRAVEGVAARGPVPRAAQTAGRDRGAGVRRLAHHQPHLLHRSHLGDEPPGPRDHPASRA